MTVMVRNKGQVTIPADVRKKVRLEDGDPVQIEVVEGAIVLRPLKTIDAEQAWFWTAGWQDRVRSSVEDVAAGRSEVYESGEDLLAALEALD
jgi:AbrB family looped-hinge helix DNA binding protein